MRISQKDLDRFERMNKSEEELREEGFSMIAGLDEAGRGPLAGPVACAVCILKPDEKIWGLNDSKKISEKRREELAIIIREKCLAYSVSFVSAFDIDRINILEATKEGMENAIHTLSVRPDMLLLDALHLPNVLIPQRAIIRGDASVNAIAAASILAKTSRDQYMRELDMRYPGYGFSRHKGYGTREHLEALRKLGPCPEHRLSFLSHFPMGEEGGEKEVASGYRAEQFVAEHLVKQGYRILARNFRLLPYGELDLIALHQNVLYIIEVKARSSKNYREEAIAAVPPRKRGRQRSLGLYFAQSRQIHYKKISLLLAACQLDRNGDVQHIDFLEMEN